MKSNGDNKPTHSNDNEDWTQDLTKHLNFNNAKYLTTFLIVLFVIYHGYLNSLYGKLN